MPKRKFKDLKVSELMNLCTRHGDCKNCPFDKELFKVDGYWCLIFESRYALEEEIDIDA